MDYAQEQRNPRKHVVGFSIVILLHVVLIYALMNGLGRKIVKLVQKPIEVKIVEEVKPPPPPETPPPPPPKTDAPPPPFMPPVEVQVPQAQVVTNTPQVNTTSVVPTAPVRPQPPAPSAPAPAPAHAKASAASCPNWETAVKDFSIKLSKLAEEENLSPGKVEIDLEASVSGDGALSEPVILKSTNSAVNNLAKQLARRLKCNSGGSSKIQVPLVFYIPD
ncbi:hypothetical protein KSF73_08910 [Burkholderiaceae bacterium DAT-1]|nr:hypothetical protein [Burkholderiaceae bacterium DAT-1]